MTDRKTNVVSGKAPAEHEAIDDPHREALARTGFFGEQGAGTVTIAADTGRFMLALRSEKVEQPGTYGNAGGAHLAEEDPEAAARREHGEETGWDGEILAMIPAFVFRKDDFVYRNFFTVVPHEYEPELGWEADSAVWCTTNTLPAPLHFGIEALLADDASREILEGGWRRFLTDAATGAGPIDWTASSPPCQAFATDRRPLSTKTVARIARGLCLVLEALDARHAAMLSALRDGPGTFEFELVLEGDRMPDEAAVDRIYEAGCDDALLGMSKGVLSLGFIRKSTDLGTAVAGAVRDAEAGGMTVTGLRIEGIPGTVPATEVVG